MSDKKIEELHKLAFKCLRCGKLFFVYDRGEIGNLNVRFAEVKLGDDFILAGMTMCGECLVFT